MKVVTGNTGLHMPVIWKAVLDETIEAANSPEEWKRIS